MGKRPNPKAKLEFEIILTRAAAQIIKEEKADQYQERFILIAPIHLNLTKGVNTNIFYKLVEKNRLPYSLSSELCNITREILNTIPRNDFVLSGMKPRFNPQNQREEIVGLKRKEDKVFEIDVFRVPRIIVPNRIFLFRNPHNLLQR